MGDYIYSYICELIFINTSDPLILQKLRRVNVLWKNSIDKILETSDIWKRACLNELPSEPIPCMITKLFPMLYFENYHDLDDSTVWRTVYISYRKWMIFSKLRVSVEDSYDFAARSNFSEGIRDFASCDNYFAIGTTKNRIYLFDFNQLNEPLYTVNFEKPIENIRFWSPASGDLFLVTMMISGTIKFWNIFAMMEVECINSTDDIKSDGLCTGSTNILFATKNGKFDEYKHTKDGIRSYYRDNLQLQGLEIKCFLENNKMIYVSTFGDSVTLFNYRYQTSDGNYDIIEEDHKEFPVRLGHGISVIEDLQFVFLTSNVILQLSADRNACLLIYNQETNWSIYEPFKNFGDRDVITAGILHGKFLILGFKTGHVRIYTVENIEELKAYELDLNSGIEYELSNYLDNEEIEQLQVAETQGKLIIIAITPFIVYSINFFSINSPQ
ncbi:uncharacterized protein LOC130674548 isoform X1 [Microplitis mediator]|uniref:uncharacterized protein LOC130674548 isoform X1 n=1 Tax=Microplitis mediator TaxID=375433 RepID=UPI00255605A9|nr:uncharacterized protein LOC130674548 isoform X1 [Microplitis mediator]